MGRLESHSAKKADRRYWPIVTARFDDRDRAGVTHRPFHNSAFFRFRYEKPLLTPMMPLRRAGCRQPNDKDHGFGQLAAAQRPYQ